MIPKTKNRSRLHYWLADKQSQAVDPAATSLLLDLDGNLTECSGANFVVVENDAIFTPTSRNILEGVSLVTLRELAPELGLGWVEKEFAALRRGQCRRGLVDQHSLLSGSVYAHQQYADWRREARTHIRAGDGGVEPAGGDGYSGAA